MTKLLSTRWLVGALLTGVLRATSRPACALAAALLLSACAPATSLVEARPADTCFALSALDEGDRALADSVLAVGLDHEGLYTLAAGLKPVSTLIQESLPLARPDSVPGGVLDAAPPGFASAAARAETLYRVADALRCGPVEVVVVPFARSYEGGRILQVLAVDRPGLDATLTHHARFWSSLGLAPGADPALVVSVVEHASAYDRWRGYGHLFGYPDDAVTFFVEAGRESDSTGQFVARDFVHAPVHARETGHFTWAVPQGHALTEADSLRLRAAADVLEAYRQRRSAYLRPDSTVRAADLLRDWARQPRRTFAFQP